MDYGLRKRDETPSTFSFFTMKKPLKTASSLKEYSMFAQCSGTKPHTQPKSILCHKKASGGKKLLGTKYYYTAR